MSTKSDIGKTKRSTDNMIDDAIAQQNSWLENRRLYARRFLKKLNVFARPTPKKEMKVKTEPKQSPRTSRGNGGVLRSYWFPIVCVILIILILVWVLFIRTTSHQRVVIVPVINNVPEKVISENDTPSFDIVRIERDGNIVVAGRWAANKNVSIMINNKIVATERTDANGEFVYAPKKPLPAGNYTLSLVGVGEKTKSSNKVFLYISERGYENSISLLMTPRGSTVLQAPSMVYGDDLTVSKIDYLDNGRLIVTGDAMPRLRVSLWLNDEYMGFARVSDYRHYGLGADIGKLKPGNQYSIGVRMHDGDGRTIATIKHDFIMPKTTGDDDTFYTVRRGDCLWIIARNFMRRGILFSMIADRNHIENPDLIFPKQRLQIPVIK